MTPTNQQIIDIVTELKIDNKVKQSFCNELKEGNFNDELFDKILPALVDSMEEDESFIAKLLEEQKEIEEEIIKQETELENILDEEKQERISLHKKLILAKYNIRDILKKLYEEVKRRGEKIMSGIDKDEEGVKHGMEETETDEIRKNLGIK